MTAGWGELAAFGTAFGWGVSSYAHGAVGRMVGAAGVTLLRLPYQLAWLGLMCFVTGADTSLSSRAVLLLFLSGLTGLSLSDFMLYKCMTVIGPQLAVLLISMSSGFTAFFGWIFLNETLPAQAVAGIILTLAGIVVVVGERGITTLFPGQEMPTGRTFAFGVALGAVGAMFMAASLLFWKAAMQDGQSPLWATFVRIAFAALLLWGTGLFRGWSMQAVRGVRTQPRVFWILLGASGFSSGGMWAAGVAMDLSPAGVAATIIGLQPVMVTMLGAVLKRRIPSLRVMLGTVMAFSGTALVCLR